VTCSPFGFQFFQVGQVQLPIAISTRVNQGYNYRRRPMHMVWVLTGIIYKHIKYQGARARCRFP